MRVTDGPTLVVLAAGLGSRFGGAKQLTPVGPAGETVLDYDVHDACSVGFGAVVLVVRGEIEGVMAHHVRAWPPSVLVSLVVQEHEPHATSIPRRRPLGTAHAVLAAGAAVRGSFVVVNADDLYGRDALRLAHEYLTAPEPGHGLIAYRVERTAVGPRPVSRALVQLASEQALEGLQEGTARRADDGALRWSPIGGGAEQRLAGDESVSMNLWAFRPTLFERLRTAVESFVVAAGADDELRLPDVIDELVHDRAEPRVAVRVTDGSCVGLTHPDDLPAVRGHVRSLVTAGVYPSPLWR